MKRISLCALAVLALLATPAEMRADQKVKKRMSVGEQGFDTTSYIKGARSRDEMNMGGMEMITIQQCDTGKTITVNDRTKTYMVTSSSAATPAPARPGAAAKGRAPAPEEAIEVDPPAMEGTRKGGTVTFTTSIVDTGETKDFFGYKARHVKMTMTSQSSPDACDPNQSMKMASDGWYIDFEEKTQTCQRPGNPMSMGDGGPMRSSPPSCQDKIRYTGPGIMAMTKLGYPVDVTTTMAGKDGKETSMRIQALEISKGTLDAALFDVPAGYKEAKNMAELYGFSMGGMLRGALGAEARNRAPSRAPVMTPEVKGVVRRNPMTPEVGPKKPGMIRVGVVVFDDKSGKVTDADQLRRKLIDDIERFGYEAIPIDSRSDAAAMADCKTKECDYVLFNALAQQAPAVTKKKIGGFLGRAVSGGLAGAAAGAATGKDEGGPFQGSVDYRLFKINGGDPSLASSLEAKGDGGGAEAMNKESREVAKQIQKDKS